MKKERAQLEGRMFLHPPWGDSGSHGEKRVARGEDVADKGVLVSENLRKEYLEKPEQANKNKIARNMWNRHTHSIKMYF